MLAHPPLSPAHDDRVDPRLAGGGVLRRYQLQNPDGLQPLNCFGL